MSEATIADPDDWIPGTVHLVDVDKSLHVQHNGDSDLILIPQPSDDPNDPLRWSKRKKYAQFAILWSWSFFTAVATNWVGPAWTEWTIVFDTTYTVLNNTSAVGWCLVGIGCFVLQPFAMKFGRRGVYLFASLCQLSGNIVGGCASSVGHLYGSQVMTCFACAPADSLVQISTTDMFFQHERANIISILTFALYSGSYLGPICAGYIVESQGWRWCYWWLVIFFGVLFAIQVFLMEDSTFTRKSVEEVEETVVAEIKSQKSHQEVNLKDPVSTASLEAADELEDIPKKKSYFEKLSLIETKYNDKRPLYVIFLRPLLALGLPAFVWGGFVYGVQLMWLSLIGTTQSEFFSYAPYNFSTAATGDTYFASLIGTFLGTFWGGKLSDMFVAWKARKNGGVLEPEFRLWLILLPAVINSAGILMYGLGCSAGVHWIVPGGFGMAFIGFGIGSAGALTITYALDCYPDMQSEGLVLMLFMRSMIGTGFTFAIQPWLDRNGTVTTTWLMFMISIVLNFSCLPFIKWGKFFRRKTKKFYLKYSDENVLFR